MPNSNSSSNSGSSGKSFTPYNVNSSGTNSQVCPHNLHIFSKLMYFVIRETAGILEPNLVAVPIITVILVRSTYHVPQTNSTESKQTAPTITVTQIHRPTTTPATVIQLILPLTATVTRSRCVRLVVTEKSMSTSTGGTGASSFYK